MSKNYKIQKQKDEKRKKRSKLNRRTPCNYVMPPDSRLNVLAIPRHPVKKYVPTEFKRRNQIEVVKQQQVSSRTEQLAVPIFR